MTMPPRGCLWQQHSGRGVPWPLAALLPAPRRSELACYGRGDPSTHPNTPGTMRGGLLWVAAMGTKTCHCHLTKPSGAIRHCPPYVVNMTLPCSQIRFGSRRIAGPRIADLL